MILKDAIKQVLSARDITNSKILAQEVNKLLKRRRKESSILLEFENYLLEKGILDIAHRFEDGQIIYRERLFSQACFKVEISDWDLQSGFLVIGHRFLPFIIPTLPSSQLHFEDEEGHALAVELIELSLSDDTYSFLRMMPPYGDQDLDIDFVKRMVKTPAINIKDWAERNKVSTKDQLLVTTLDYEKHQYRISRLSSKQLAADAFLIKHHDDVLTNSMIGFLTYISMPVPIDLFWFWVFAFASKDTPQLLEKPGTALSALVNEHSHVGVYSEGNFPFIHFLDFHESLGDMMAEQISNMKPIVPGKAKDLEGILLELGTVYSSVFIGGKIIQQLQEGNEVDLDSIKDIILRTDDALFANEAQMKNFSKAFEKFSRTVTKDWSNKRLSLPMSQLLNKALLIKSDISEFVMEASMRLTDASQLDFNTFLQYQPVDAMADQILEAIMRGDILPPAEAKNMSTQLHHIRATFLQFRDSFFEDL